MSVGTGGHRVLVLRFLLGRNKLFGFLLFVPSHFAVDTSPSDGTIRPAWESAPCLVVRDPPLVTATREHHPHGGDDKRREDA